ncbi:hypothetical protein MKW92_002460 [Papaver armeniacum]|nr:hypothetical protein MKW92_002460 [Papaver armeniacum]
MAGGSFSRMQMVLENPATVASWCKPPTKPWCGHPGTPNACKTMKYCLSLLLPDYSDSEIDDLNTYLLTIADSKADYEDLYELEGRVMSSPFMFSGPIVDHPCNCSFTEENLSPNYEPASGRPAGGLSRPCIGPQKQ